MVTGDAVTVELPVTLRGVGFVADFAYKRATAELKREPPLSMNQFYRLCLAQVQLQMIRSEMTKRGVTMLPPTRKQTLVQPWMNFEEVVASHPATLKAIAVCINQLGTFTDNGINYVPFIPAQRQWKVHRPAVPMEEASPAKKGRVLELHEQPDPYVVTYTNLRRTVERLASVDTSRDVRRYFRERNPIPGCVWDDRDLLMNPDEIISEHYDLHDLNHELGLLDQFTSLLNSARTAYMLGTLSFTGQGARSQVVTYYGESYALLPQPVIGAAEGQMTASLTLTDVELMMGGLCRFEYPDPIHEREQDEYAARSRRLVVRKLQCL